MLIVENTILIIKFLFLTIDSEIYLHRLDFYFYMGSMKKQKIIEMKSKGQNKYCQTQILINIIKIKRKF
jgi:hypothetical protein